MPKFNKGQRVKHIEAGKTWSPYFLGHGTVVRYQGGSPYVRWGNGTEGTVPEDELLPAGSYDKAKVSKIVGEEFKKIIAEASKDYTAQCMDCGSYFTTKSQNPKNCPQCLGRDIDVLADPEDNKLTKESVLSEALTPAAHRVYSQFRQEFEEPASQVLKLYLKAPMSGRYVMFDKLAKKMGLKLTFKDMQEISFQLALWLKKEKRINIPYPRRQLQTTEASKRFSVQCMECGKKFKTASMLPTCPKCGGSDVDVTESLQEGEFQGIADPRVDHGPRGSKVGWRAISPGVSNEQSAILRAKKIADEENVDTKVLVATGPGGKEIFYIYKKKPKNESLGEASVIHSKDEAEALARMLDKQPKDKAAQGAAKMLRSPQWKVIAGNPDAVRAVLDIIKDSPEYKQWRQRNSKRESIIGEKEINVRQTTPQPTERKASEEARKLGFKKGFHIMNTPYGWVASEYRTSFDPGRQKND